MVSVEKSCKNQCNCNINEILFTDIEYLKSTMPPSVEAEFFEFLRNTTAKDVTLYAIEEGSVVFPRYAKKISISHILVHTRICAHVLFFTGYHC